MNKKNLLPKQINTMEKKERETSKSSSKLELILIGV